MQAKDVISLVFSAIALVLSILSMYISVHEVDDIQVQVAQFSISNDPSHHDQDNVITHVAFINRGNQPALVTGAEFIAMPKLDYGDGAFGGPICPKEAGFPFVLEKNQMKVVELYQRATSLESNAEPGTSTLHYGLRFASINGKGKEQGTEVLFSTINFKDKKITGYKDDHLSVSLAGRSDISFRLNDIECSAQRTVPSDVPASAASTGGVR